MVSPSSHKSRSNLGWWSQAMYSFLQAVQQQICISNQLTPTGQGIVNCIFCVGIFIDLSRSQGAKDEILLPNPTLDIQVPQYVPLTANSQKNPQFNIKHCSLLRTQLMHLHKCHLTILSLQHMQVAYLRKSHRMAQTDIYSTSHSK